MNDRQAKASAWIFLVFLAVYLGPSLVIAIWSIFSQLSGDTLGGRVFSFILSNQNTVFDLIQKSAFAIFAALSISFIWELKYPPYIALGLCLAAIFACIVNSVNIGSADFLRNFSDSLPPDSAVPSDVERLAVLANSYVSKITDTALLYMGLLLGVEFVRRKHDAEESAAAQDGEGR